MNCRRLFLLVLVTLLLFAAARPAAAEPKGEQEVPQGQARQMRQMLDAPLLFVRRHSYVGIHIYDTYYKWPPGGGGIYVLENPSALKDEWIIRPVIDPTTEGTLGVGVYTDPELSWDAKRLLFCFKGSPEGSTVIYEIGVDGKGLRAVTEESPSNDNYEGRGWGRHDISPAYLPDGRIVFLSTRASGLVPCNNTGVAVLHVMNADGSDVHPISVNNVNEFDPVVMHDGGILFGRWEYVDKNALTIQSLWSVRPDGGGEQAVFANNMVFPEAVLDARPVPDSHLIVGTLAKHNGTPRGSIAFLDTRLGKNSASAITNLEHPENPVYDLGDSCEPWPLSEDVVIASMRPKGAKRNVIAFIDRDGHQVELLADADIDMHSPMLIKPRTVPPAMHDLANRDESTGRFFLQDIYQGMPEVKRGDVKWLRIAEETSRVSGSPGSPNPYNQTFLVSAALAFSVKNFLGVVPVEPDGSAYFEVPSGRAVYLQALDAEGRLVQSMRTFIQASPGRTRSCIGCHESKASAPERSAVGRSALLHPPRQIQDESWGSGFVDFPSMIQPILDRHCVGCHGGKEGIAAGMDLSGGWTEHFSISYENLVSRRETQLTAYWISGIDCMNGTAPWSSQLFAPRSHGSGAAPLADILVSGHGGRIPNLTRPERDLIMAWIDTNGLFHGNWDYTDHGYTLMNWGQTKKLLVSEMKAGGCMECHGAKDRPIYFENDWINLRDPEMSRLLRAPLADKSSGHGLGMCRARKADAKNRRIRLLVSGYAHAVQPSDRFPRREFKQPNRAGAAVVSFASPENVHYQNMLAIIRDARTESLAKPRIDMPGAVAVGGACREFVPLSLSATLEMLKNDYGPKKD